MMCFPTVIDNLVYTIWGYSINDAQFMDYPAVTSVDFGGIIYPLIMIVRIVGYIAVFKGLMMLAKYGHGGAQPGTSGKAVIHIFGGVMAINILGTWDILRSTVGII